MLDELVRIRYTRAWTNKNSATFVRMSVRSGEKKASMAMVMSFWLWELKAKWDWDGRIFSVSALIYIYSLYGILF